LFSGHIDFGGIFIWQFSIKDTNTNE
jgi:hypothetical protein